MDVVTRAKKQGAVIYKILRDSKISRLKIGIYKIICFFEKVVVGLQYREKRESTVPHLWKEVYTLIKYDTTLKGIE